MKKEQYIITELLDGRMGQTKPVIWQHAMGVNNHAKLTQVWGKNVIEK
jgi:hypothetical protein